MFCRVCIFISILLLASIIVAQPIIEWQHPLGGSGVDCAYSIVETSDGGYLSIGHSESDDGDVTFNHGSLDVWITKLDNKGALQWQHSYGGSEADEAYSVKETNDGGYVVAGHSASDDEDVNDHLGIGGIYDGWIIKIDALGTLEWERSCGWDTSYDYLYSIEPTTDGGYIAIGTTMPNLSTITVYDIWVVKLDPSGAITWQKKYGGPLSDEGWCIHQTDDGGYLLCGKTTLPDAEHGWVAKIDNLGSIQWEQTYGDTNNGRLYYIDETTDHNVIACGTLATGTARMMDLWVLKIDGAGKTIWSKTYGGSGIDGSHCVHETQDNGYIVSGTTTSNDGDVTGGYEGSDAWVLKLTSVGNLEWQKDLGGDYVDEAYDIKETSDGGFIFTGSTLSDNGDVVGHHDPGYVSDFWVVKLIPQQTKQPSILGFKTTPAALSCLSTIDSLHILFPASGSFLIKNISMSGKDAGNFISLMPSGTIVSVQDSLDFRIPIQFTPSSGGAVGNYDVMVDITIHNNSTNKDFSFSIPLSGYSLGSLAVTITAQLANPTAYAGDNVELPLRWSYAPKQPAIALDALNIRELSFDFAFNTNLLIIENDDFASAFVSNLSGWSCDGSRSRIDEAAKTMHLVLVGNSPLPDSTDLVGSLLFKAALTANDTSTPFRMTACNVMTGAQQNLIGSCGTLTSNADTTFTELPQCGDNYIRKILRNETIQPFSITTSSNPVTTHTVTVICNSNIAGAFEGTLYNMMGIAVKTSWASATLKKGENLIIGSVGDLPAGVYNYLFNCEGYRVSGKLVVAN